MFYHLAAVLFIVVHAPDGQEITLNVAEISSIKKPREVDGHFAKGTNCLLTMTNGKFFLTTESCLDIVKKIAELDKQK
jgi:uncharacterized protein YlzI (FlbEa/FlbD family)